MGRHLFEIWQFCHEVIYLHRNFFLGQCNAPIYLNVFMCYNVGSTYPFIAMRQAFLVVKRLQNLTRADLAYYWASDIRFDTSGQNKFADYGLKAAMINGQYTIRIIPYIFSLKIFCKGRIYYFTVFIVVVYTI